MEDELFTRPHELPISICKKCQHGVRPKEITQHLKGTQHRVPFGIAKQAKNAAQQWDGIAKCEQWIVPKVVSESFLGLSIYSDGILCTRDSFCRFAARSVGTIRKHWHIDHQ